MRICLLSSTSREDFPASEIGTLARCSRNSNLLRLLLLNNFLVFLEEILEIGCYAHHATIQRVNSGLDGLFVRSGRLLGHVLMSSLDLLLIDLYLSQLIFDLNAQLADIVLLRCKQRDVLLKSVKLSLVPLHIVNFQVSLCQERDQCFASLRALPTL